MSHALDASEPRCFEPPCFEPPCFEPLGDSDASELLAWLERRYGITVDTFAEHRFWRRPGARSIWIASADFERPAHLTCETLGILMARKIPPSGKLTSTFLQRFGSSAIRNVVRLAGGDLADFLARQPVRIDDEARGYQIVCAGERVLGAGFARLCGDGDDAHVVLRSELPKAWTAFGPPTLLDAVDDGNT